MPIAPCKDVLNECFPCAGDDPSANTSAEGFDANVFIARSVIIRPPQINKLYAQQGCKRWCYSTISQADAQACADAQASECVNDTAVVPPVVNPPIVPPVGFPVVTVIATEPETTFGEDPGVFTLTRTGSFAQPLTVQFALSGSAENGVDYQTLTAQATIDAGDNTVDVIVIPEDTDSTDSKTCILTVLGTAAYSAGAHNADTVTIASQDCGVDKYELVGYDASVAEFIAQMRPSADDSDLPEWDGVLRQVAGENKYRSNGACYSINGKAVELVLVPGLNFEDTRTCSETWFPTTPGCFVCQGSNFPTYLHTDTLFATGGDDPLIFFVSKTLGQTGNYVSYEGPACPGTFFGSQTYRVGIDQVARATYGDSPQFIVASV